MTVKLGEAGDGATPSGLEGGLTRIRDSASTSQAEVKAFDASVAQILLDHSIDSFFLLDEHLHVVGVNRHACESLGYSREELIGMHPREFDVGLDEQAIERLRQGVAAGQMSSFETYHRRKDGTVFPVEIRSRQFEQGGRRLGVNLARDITERKRAEEERLAHLWFLSSMDRVNRSMQGKKDVEEMMSDVLATVLETFECDRAFLVYPCKPGVDSYRVVMEQSRPEFPGAYAQGIADALPSRFTAALAALAVAACASDTAVPVGPDCEIKVPESVTEHHGIKSALVTAVYPKIGEPYLFGIQQCSRARRWTPEEQRLLQEIGRRLADALTSLLTLRSLRESEKRLDEAQRIAHVGYWDRELDSGRIRLSDEACRIFGVPPEESLLELAQWHDRWLALIHPEDRPRVADAAAAALRGGPPYDVEYRVIHSAGDVRIIHSRGEVRRDVSGRPFRMFGTMQDITELRQAEHERGASEQRFRIFADHATDSFFLLDENFTVLDVNRQACESLGYTREELIGMRSPDFDPRVTEAELARLKELSNAGDTPTFESVHRRKDGSEFPVEVRGRVFEQGGRRCYMTTARDITERERAREALLEARVAERLRIARELHDTLLQDFQGVLLQLRAAQRFLSNQPEKAREVLEGAIEQAAQAVKEAREAVQGLRAHRDEPNDLAASLARLGKELAAEPASHAMAVAVMVEGTVRSVRANLRYELFQITAEALRNAFQHSRGTRVEVELRYEASLFRLRVRDDGRGIDSKVMGEGRGGHFGLRGMHERATIAGGKLSVWSAPGSGTEVELIVPGPEAYAPARNETSRSKPV